MIRFSVIRLSWPRLFTRWRRQRQRWPLTRQIATLFTVLMIGNAVLISTALDVWSEYRVEQAVKTMTPASQRAYRSIDQGSLPAAADLRQLNRELKPIGAQIDADFDTALYVLIAAAGGFTMMLGYLMLGRVGKGLGSVAMAARRIAGGDLTARAKQVGFASREETQLIDDFNTMSVALQRAERELAESAASIAHELRTPLTILRGRLHGISDGVFALEPEEIEGLLYQVEGLGRLVDDLQTLSLAGAQRLILARAPCDLGEEVRRVLSAMAPDLAAAGLQPVLALSPSPLSADGVRLRQIIAAVLSNAVRYAAHSGVLRITTHSEDGQSVLEIIDHGPGLPDAAEARVFERFWRAEVSRSRVSGGSGLGLSVVRAIVEAHGGRVTLGNHDGGGAHFVMHLPGGNAAP